MSRHRDLTFDVSVVTSGHDVADARLHRLAAALTRSGMRVEVLGLGTAVDGPDGATTRTWPRRGMAGRVRLVATLPWLAGGRALLVLDPDALLGALPAAALRRRRVVADVHEDYAALLADRSWATGPAGVLARGVAWLSTAGARHSALTVVADEHVPPRTAPRRLVVRNLPDPRMLPAVADRDPQPRAVYVGDIRRSRGLPMMLDTAARAPHWTFDLIGPVSAEDRSWLDARLAADADLAARVRQHGRQPPRQAWQIAAGAWVGLCLLDPTPAFQSSVPSKLYEYLALGLVPIVTDLPRQRQLIEQSGAGYVVADASAAAAALDELAADPGRVAQLAKLGRGWRPALPNGTGYDEFADAVRKLVRG